MQIKRFIQAVLVPQAIVLLALTHSANLARAASGTLPPSTSAQYRITTFTVPGNTFLGPLGPSESGMAAGYFQDSAGSAHGFLWDDGVLTPIDDPGWGETWPTSINDHGIVTGIMDNHGVTYGFLYSVRDGTWSQLPRIPGIVSLIPGGNTAINNAGIVVGAGTHADGTETAWIWDGRSYSFFNVPGADEFSLGTQPLGINDRGQVTGFYQDAAGAFHGFVTTGRRATTLDVPGADWTWAFATNNRGDTVGCAFVFSPAFQEQGFILHKGRFFTFPVPGWGGLTGINDHGELVGCYETSNAPGSPWTGFVAKPQ